MRQFKDSGIEWIGEIPETWEVSRMKYSLYEQRSIAAYLAAKCADIDRLISLKQQKIEALKDYKKSVIYEAVTGKTEIV